MLMQLIGGSAASSMARACSQVGDDREDQLSIRDDLEAIAAMLAMPLAAVPAMLPWAAQPAAASDAGVDPLELLGLGGGGKGSDRVHRLLKSDLDGLVAYPRCRQTDADNGNGVGSLSPFNETQQVRAPSAEPPPRGLCIRRSGRIAGRMNSATGMSLMVDRNQHAVSLRLSPEHLGPLEVRISITDDKASVWFGAAHADTRAAIENALPRLREMFTAQGLSLADAGVFREPPRDQTACAADVRGGSPEHVVGSRSARQYARHWTARRLRVTEEGNRSLAAVTLNWELRGIRRTKGAEPVKWKYFDQLDESVVTVPCVG